MDCVLTLMGVYFLYRRFILRDFCSKWKVALSLSPALFFLNGQRRNNHTPIHVNTKVFPILNIAEITDNCPFRVPRWCKGTVPLGGTVTAPQVVDRLATHQPHLLAVLVSICVQVVQIFSRY
jgi:hypothetical protein